MYARSVVLFKAGFTVPTEKDIEGPLAVLASWLRARLGEQGIEVGEPRWCDFEFELSVRVGSRTYPLSVSFDFVRWEWFQIYFAPEAGFLWRLRGGRDVGALTRLSEAIHGALLGRDGVCDIRWYHGFPKDPDADFERTPR